MFGKYRRTHGLLSFAALTVVAIFGVWWFNPTHVPSNFLGANHIFDFLLFAILSYIIWHPIVMEALAWAIASHIKPRTAALPPENLKVALVTTFVPQSESIELLAKTLPAMVGVKYDHDTWVLDEGNDPRVRDLCAKLGAYHYSRHGVDYFNAEEGKFARKTKGGNHNSWYANYGDQYDIVAQMDTDFVPSPEYLTKTLGYFRDPTVAFVGTPQIYGNIDESLIARGAAQQTYNFYGPILRGLYGMDTTLLIGANHVMRVSALKSVNHYSAHITEDLLTGMKLHARGWKSVYVHEALAIGEGPTSWQAYFSQQMRWAYGCIDVLFRHSPKLFRYMNFRRRLYYLILQQHYFSGVAMILSMVAITLYALFGINSANIDLLSFLKLYLPVIFSMFIMSLWLQSFSVRPNIEKGLHLAGKIVSLASWPIFFLAFIGVLRGKRLTYRVTPKGENMDTNTERLVSFGIFRLHIAIGLYCAACLVAAVVTHHRSIIMLGWMAVSGLLMFILPFVLFIERIVQTVQNLWRRFTGTFRARYFLFELSAEDAEWLPGQVTEKEKLLYLNRRHIGYITFSVVSLFALALGMVHFLRNDILFVPVWVMFIITLAYQFISLVTSVFTKDFDYKAHQKLVANWRPNQLPTVDIFLPVAGEDYMVIKNTWEGVQEMRAHYPGPVQVYCLDDGADENIKNLARDFEFSYLVRPDRGRFKKAGNLQHALGYSSGKFIAIFDADFRPRHDFLDELLPHFYQQRPIGIVQSPQYFDVHPDQGWLERGAGAVQELFYRYTQVTRQNYGASICVGSNAIYRRDALENVGGFALIDHSEDVHTGFNMQSLGWHLEYVPIILAKGLCPASMTTFFKQQYRWCLGSLSLIGSDVFRRAKLPWRSRLSYYSGLLYYIHTALNSVFIPLLPILLLWRYADVISWNSYLYALPALIVLQVFYPIWHDATFGIEAWSAKIISGWSHLFAIGDTLLHRTKQWMPSGTKVKSDNSYRAFRIAQVLFNFIPASLWVGLALFRTFSVSNPFVLFPILCAGLYFWLISIKVTLFAVQLPSTARRSLPTKLLHYVLNAN